MGKHHWKPVRLIKQVLEFARDIGTLPELEVESEEFAGFVLLLFSHKSKGKKIVPELRAYTTEEVVRTYKKVFDNNSKALRRTFFQAPLVSELYEAMRPDILRAFWADYFSTQDQDLLASRQAHKERALTQLRNDLAMGGIAL